jgi:actin-like ATPase involved in cell morphogenesis
MNASINIIVAMDIGTSRSGWGYTICDGTNEKFFFRKWPGAPTYYIKTASQILYSPEGGPIAFGYEAGRLLADAHRVKGATNGFTLAYNFKTKLFEGGKWASDTTKREFEVKCLMTDLLKYLKEHCLTELRTALGTGITEQQIRWCLTIPALWKQQHQDTMRIAAKNAGLIEDLYDSRLNLVLEPEAAAIYCQEMYGSSRGDVQLSKGKRFLVVDVGGGTTDITFHEIDDGAKLKEVNIGGDAKCGSTNVNKAFLDLLSARLGKKAVDRIQEELGLHFVNLMNDFEKNKCEFDSVQTQSPGIYLQISNQVSKLLDAHFPNEFANLRDNGFATENEFFIDNATMNSLFQPTVQQVVREVERVLEIVRKSGTSGNASCDYLFLVGGYANCGMLAKAIRDEFEGNAVQKVIIPPRPEEAVLSGALSYGVNPGIIRSRKSRLTYGIECSMPFRPGIDPESEEYKFLNPHKNKYYCNYRFAMLVKRGADVDRDGDPFTTTIAPSAPDQTSAAFPIFASEYVKDLCYTKDPKSPASKRLWQVGEIVAEMPDTRKGLDREVEIRMHFEATLVRCNAVDLTTGKTTECTFKPSFSWFPEEVK